MPAPPVLPTSFDATNARADDAAPLPLRNNGKEKHHTGVSLSLGAMAALRRLQPSSVRKLWTFTDGVANRSSRTSEPGLRRPLRQNRPLSPGALNGLEGRRDRPLREPRGREG